MSVESADIIDSKSTAIVAEVPQLAAAPPAEQPTPGRRAPLTWEQKFLAEDGTEDPTINAQPLETYLQYAERERLREENDYRPIPDAPWTVLLKRITREGVAVTPNTPGQKRTRQRRPRKAVTSWVGSLRRSGSRLLDETRRYSTTSTSQSHGDESKDMTTELELAVRGDGEDSDIISPHERETAYRLMRVANWQVVFYLIFTDMCGFFPTGTTFRVLGWAPALLIFIGFSIMAFCCGQILWKLYMALDSERYPIKSYGDIAERTFGPAFRNVVNTVQFLQLGLQVSTFIMLNGHALAVIIDKPFCFMLLNVFVSIIGICGSQMRSLRSLSAFAFFGFFGNMIAFVATLFGMGMFDPANKPPDVPLITHAWVPPESKAAGWMVQMEGAQIAVFAYAGAFIFTEFMAEMRRPRDFWKAAITAQLLILCMYLFYGMFTYAMQGQFTDYLAGRNIGSRGFVIISGLVTLILCLNISILYSHIACKMVYRLLLRRFFKSPSVSSPKSAPWWALTTVGYWVFAWVVGSAIPNITAMSNVIASALVIPLTYIIPPALLLGHWVQRDAMTADHPWRPGMEPLSNRADSFKALARWKRGFRPNWYFKLVLIIFIIAGLGFFILGLISSITRVKDSFGAPGGTASFSCQLPAVDESGNYGNLTTFD